MKWNIFFLVTLISISFGCSRPEDKLVGSWEFDNYKIDESGVGFLLNMLPSDWKNTVDTYLTEAKGLTNSKLTFESDLTYKESFSGAIEQFASINGTYSVTPDITRINLKNREGEQIMEILEFTDTYFVYKKDFSKFAIPVTLLITYKRLK